MIGKKTFKRIMIDESKCIGCKSCVLACMVHHNENGNSIYNLNLLDENNRGKTHLELDSDSNPIPIVCRHCSNPKCVYSCVSGAMYQDDETDYILYNKDKCISCLMCIMSCPYGVLRTSTQDHKYIEKCDMCLPKDKPSCVEYCPTGALTVEEVE